MRSSQVTLSVRVASLVLVTADLVACSNGGTGIQPVTRDSGTGTTSASGGAHTSNAMTTSTGASSTSNGPPSDAGGPVSSPCLRDDAGLPPWKSIASGTLTGPGISASFCTGVYVELFSVAGGPPAHFVLDAFDPSMVVVTTPADASNPDLFVNVGIGAAAPGEYASAGPAACGDIAFDYYLPVPPGIDCSMGVPPDCSAGCTSACSASGECTPCAPAQPSAQYGATADEDCIDAMAQPVSGHWSVTLTSVEPYPKSSATEYETYYVVHGSISGSLIGGADAGTESAGFSLVF